MVLLRSVSHMATTGIALRESKSLLTLQDKSSLALVMRLKPPSVSRTVITGTAPRESRSPRTPLEASHRLPSQAQLRWSPYRSPPRLRSRLLL
jgi:hypothetical protein